MNASNFVTLRGGLAVPTAAVLLALALEDRGCRLRVDEDGSLVASSRELLTDSDRAQIRKYRDHLKAIVSYEAPAVQ
jgi:hypothetical protein